MITGTAFNPSDILETLNDCGVPEHNHQSIVDYVMDGVRMGGFLEAAFSNDLAGAFGHADHFNRQRLGNLTNWLTWHAPSPCWHSPDKVADWVHMGGLNGSGK